MKGAIVGLLYAPVLVFASLNVGIETIFNVTSSSWRDGTLISCGFWYLQIKLILVFIVVSSLQEEIERRCFTQ